MNFELTKIEDIIKIIFLLLFLFYKPLLKFLGKFLQENEDNGDQKERSEENDPFLEYPQQQKQREIFSQEKNLSSELARKEKLRKRNNAEMKTRAAEKAVFSAEKETRSEYSFQFTESKVTRENKNEKNNIDKILKKYTTKELMVVIPAIMEPYDKQNSRDF